MDPSGHGDHVEHGGNTLPGHEGHAGPDRARPLGFSSAEGGLRFDGRPAIVSAGEHVEFSFAIVGADGRSLTEFDELHERRMHLIVVRRDLTGFQHLHPGMSDDGTWGEGIVFPAGGAWRAFADFATAAGPSTLGLDVLVEGEFRPEPLPAPSTRVDVGDEVVSLDTAPGGSELRFAVTHDGRPVDVEPYLGARGHLVALRWGDLAFLHVHPIGDEDIAFEITYPGPGTYRLFLQYSVGGVVRTAAFTTVAT
jgi:hypothetical protein